MMLSGVADCVTYKGTPTPSQEHGSMRESMHHNENHAEFGPPSSNSRGLEHT